MASLNRRLPDRVILIVEALLLVHIGPAGLPKSFPRQAVLPHGTANRGHAAFLSPARPDRCPDDAGKLGQHIDQLFAKLIQALDQYHRIAPWHDDEAIETGLNISYGGFKKKQRDQREAAA